MKWGGRFPGEAVQVSTTLGSATRRDLDVAQPALRRRGPVVFESDASKSRINHAKHGIDRVHWSAVITYRGDRIRIISVRRARDEEVAIYEG